MKLKTVIVEDEVLGQEVLLGILKNYCNDSVEICGLSTTVDHAIATIEAQKPDLVFLDIKLGGNKQGAFDILNGLSNINFKIIFTTSSRQTDDILQALNKFGAKKYLLKPLDIDDVVEAVELVKEGIKSEIVSNEIEDIRKLLNNLNVGEPAPRLKLPVKNGFQYIPYEEIIMLRSNLNSTLIFLCNNKTISSSKNMKYFISTLPDQNFIRISKSFIININHVEKYSNEDGGTVFLKNDCTATLSNNYKDQFFNALDE